MQTDGLVVLSSSLMLILLFHVRSPEDKVSLRHAFVLGSPYTQKATARESHKEGGAANE